MPHPSEKTPSEVPGAEAPPAKIPQAAPYEASSGILDNSSTLSHIKSSPSVSQNSTGDRLSKANFQHKTLLRILDANLDRAREGLRIIEEWCRFGLNDPDTTAQIKHLRQVLGHWHLPEIRLARDTPGDVGTTLTHPQEANRSGLSGLLEANFARIQEALRVLEEYGKLFSPELSADCKQMRYQIYALESQILWPLLSAQGLDP